MRAASPQRLERFLYTLVLTGVMGLILALALQRLELERVPPAVELAFPEARLLAAAVDPGALAAARQAGVTTLVREPYTLQNMLDFGLAQAWHPEPDRLEIDISDERLSGHAAVYLTSQLGLSSLRIRVQEKKYIFDIQLPEGMDEIDPARFVLEIPSGPMPEGFRRALRLPAGDWNTTGDLDQFTQPLASLRPDVVLPDWRGGRGAFRFFQAYLNTPWLRRPVIALPEGAPAAGVSVLRRERRRPIVRALILSEEFLAGTSLPRMEQQVAYSLAEQGIRFIYFSPPAAWTFAQDLEWVQVLSRSIRQSGSPPGAIGAQRESYTGALAQGFIYLGIGALVFIFVWRAVLWAVGFTGQDPAVDQVLTIRLKPVYFRWIALGVPGIILIIHSEGPVGWGVKLAAFVLALLCPLLGLSSIPARPESVKNFGAGVIDGMKELLQITAWSLAGGLGISILLHQAAFVLRLDQFAGVKVAYVLPLLMGAIYFLPQTLSANWWQVRWRPDLRGATIAGCLGVLGALCGLWVLYFGVEFYGVNLGSVRVWLERGLLSAPLLLLGLTGRRWAGKSERVWPEVCIAFGLLSQVSVINTFSRIHTPLALSLSRTFRNFGWGLLVGLGLVVLCWCVRGWIKKR